MPNEENIYKWATTHQQESSEAVAKATPLLAMEAAVALVTLFKTPEDMPVCALEVLAKLTAGAYLIGYIEGRLYSEIPGAFHEAFRRE